MNKNLKIMGRWIQQKMDKKELFYLLRKIGGTHMPEFIRIPVGDRLFYDENKKSIKDERRDYLVSLLTDPLVLSADGDVIECGVYWGQTTIAMAKKLKELGSTKHVYAVDTFGVFPFDDNDYPYRKRRFWEKEFVKAKGAIHPTLEEVQQKVEEANLDNVTLLQGLVGDVLPEKLSSKKFCFANVDVDSYLATKQCLEFLKPRLSKNGIIFLDDYNEPAWKGVNKAADEILGKSSLTILKHYQAFFRKKDQSHHS